MQLRRRLIAFVGLLTLGCRGAGPSEPDRRVIEPGEPLDLLGPGCLLAAPGTGRFACIRLSARPIEGGEQDLTSESMSETFAHVQSLGADLELDVVEVAIGAEDDVWIAAVDPRLIGDAADRQRAGIELLLAARGFSEPLIGTLVLEADAEIVTRGDDFAVEARSEPTGLEFRYECRLHEGDASFEYHGTLAVLCGPDRIPQVVLDGLGGPLARLSFTEDRRFGVISIEHQDGGEGYVDATWVHHAFALDGLCGSAPTSASMASAAPSRR